MSGGVTAANGMNFRIASMSYGDGWQGLASCNNWTSERNMKQYKSIGMYIWIFTTWQPISIYLHWMINDDKAMKPTVSGFDKPTSKMINEKIQRVRVL